MCRCVEGGETYHIGGNIGGLQKFGGLAPNRALKILLEFKFVGGTSWCITSL